MIVTENEEWARKAKYLTTQAKDDEVEYIHHHIGYNYRLTNIQAAMGCAQMELLDEYITSKRGIAARYTEAFAGAPGISLPGEAPWAHNTFWMYTILIDEGVAGLGSRDLLRMLAQRKIQTRPLWQPIHLSPAYNGTHAIRCPVAERLNRQALSLPCSVGVEGSAQARVIDQIKAIMSITEKEPS